jgi:hypothetical protein
VVLDRVHLFEISHVDCRVATSLAFGLSKLARAKLVLLTTLLFTLSCKLSLDPSSIFAYVFHYPLGFGTKGSLWFGAGELEGKR